jgi:Fur family transcriptional regulator, zinc uptake regulator
MSRETRRLDGAFLRRDHDHVRCVADAMTDAATLCRERRVRLTLLRSRVLEIVWQNHKPLGAYDILAVLAAEGRSAAPPTVYRALEFLLEQGLVHRLASLNAFVGCSRPGHAGSGQFLICRSCGNAAELNDRGVERAIARSAASQGFAVHRHSVEISGVCPDCR